MKIDGAAQFTNFSGGANQAFGRYHLPTNQFLDGNNIGPGEDGSVWKRRGRTLLNAVPLPTAIHSLFRPYIAASKTFLAGAGTVLYQDSGALDGAFTALQTGLSGNAVRGFVYGNWFYFCDGTNILKYDLTNVRAWSMAKPAIAPTVAEAAGGSLDVGGTYVYKYTFIRGSEAETEAGLPAQQILTGANRTINLSVMTASADAQVTHKKIYRTANGGSVYYYLAQITNATTVYSDTGATALSAIAYDSEGNLPETIGTHQANDCCLINRRAVVLSKATRYLDFSKIGYPEAFPGVNNGYSYPVDEGQGVYGYRVVNFKNVLLVFKDRSLIGVYNTNVENPASFQYKEIGKGIGLWASDSLAEGMSCLYWLSQVKGGFKVLEYDGTTTRHISVTVDPIFNKAHGNYMANAVAWFQDYRYFISFPKSADSTENDCVWVFDTINRAWWPYAKDWGVRSAVVADGPGDSGEFYCGDGTGFIDHMEPLDIWTERGEDYALNLKTRYANNGNPDRKKFWNIYVEGKTARFEVITSTEQLNSSTQDMAQHFGTCWDGAWDGAWNVEGDTKLDKKLAQGIKGRYVTIDITEKPTQLAAWDGAWDGTWEFLATQSNSPAAIIFASVDYEIETKT